MEEEGSCGMVFKDILFDVTGVLHQTDRSSQGIFGNRKHWKQREYVEALKRLETDLEGAAMRRDAGCAADPDNLYEGMREVAAYAREMQDRAGQSSEAEREERGAVLALRTMKVLCGFAEDSVTEGNPATVGKFFER